jgi:hypothetical protein
VLFQLKHQKNLAPIDDLQETPEIFDVKKKQNTLPMTKPER